MGSCVKNICTKNYYNLLVFLQVIIDNVGMLIDVFCLF